jgi:fatty acid desaturase
MSAPTTTAASRARSDYADLASQVRVARLLERRPTSYTLRIVVTLLSYLATWAAIVWVGDSWYQTITAVLLGVVFTQVAFLGHDAGHQQIFTGRRANDRLGRLLGDLLIGLSYGWWLDKHNRHHANPNKDGFDPDIGDGVLVFTTGQVAARTGSLGRAITRHQAWLFFPLLTFEGLNLHLASALSLRTRGTRSGRGGSRRTELVMLACHAVGYLGGLLLVMSPVKALVFIGIHKAVWGLYMGCSFAPNHKGMPIIGPDEDVDYLRRQVLTSRNVRSGWFTDILLGGLNYQIEHHLFPSMPSASLRSAQRLVRAYCHEHAISYCETSLPGSYRAVLRFLHELGRPLRVANATTIDG